jgi:hypothetical protein|nr:MAG TPA: hypothetical protein [Bacteriophage sp.]
MIDTTDLTSYIPGYDEYMEEIEKSNNYEEPYDYADEYHEEMMIRKEIEKMERKVIDLKMTNMTFDEIMKLKDYVWKNDKLIPVEEGE